MLNFGTLISYLFLKNHRLCKFYLITSLILGAWGSVVVKALRY